MYQTQVGGIIEDIFANISCPLMYLNILYQMYQCSTKCNIVCKCCYMVIFLYLPNLPWHILALCAHPSKYFVHRQRGK